MHFALVALSILAVLIALLGLAVTIRPQVFTGLAKYFVRPWGIWVAAGIRIFAAALLWFTSTASRFPDLFKVLAVVALTAGLGVLIVGRQRINSINEWSVGLPPYILRLFGTAALLVGGFILWALFG